MNYGHGGELGKIKMEIGQSGYLLGQVAYCCILKY